MDCLGRAFGADDRDRTGDLRVTSALLYQLSYIGEGGILLDSFVFFIICLTPLGAIPTSVSSVTVRVAKQAEHEADQSITDTGKRTPHPVPSLPLGGKHLLAAQCDGSGNIGT